MTESKSGRRTQRRRTATRSATDDAVAFDVRALRERSKQTVKQLAWSLGVSVKTVHAWERGKAKPTGEALEEMRRLRDMLAENDAAWAAYQERLAKDRALAAKEGPENKGALDVKRQDVVC